VGLKWKFNYIHAHEEGGAIGLALAWLLRVPHLYDMHSSLPEQISNFQFSRSRLLVGFPRARAAHGVALGLSHRDLPTPGRVARSIEPGAHIVLIENAPVLATRTQRAGPPRFGRGRRAGRGAMVLYTGTFEAYQGSICCLRP